MVASALQEASTERDRLEIELAQIRQVAMAAEAERRDAMVLAQGEAAEKATVYVSHRACES